jgi:GxxExxY protein
MEPNELSSKIIGAAITVHRELGPGLLESVYHSCLLIELRSLALSVQSEIPVPIEYRGQTITKEGFVMDLLVENTIIVELKSLEELHPVHEKQLLTYLRLAKKPLGLLINFNVPTLKDGIRRVINSPK